MHLNNFQLPTNLLVAIEAAIEAATLIMRFYSDGFNANAKSDGSPVTEADIASSALIRSMLLKTNIAVMDEEIQNAHFEERKNWDAYWCIDPLDGTKEFVKRNGEFVVNIALIENQQATFGVIASPVKNELIFGGSAFGAFHTDFGSFARGEARKLTPFMRSDRNLSLVSSRSHHVGSERIFVDRLLQEFGEVDFIQRGSALKFFDLVLGNADVYPRFAPTMEWDIAAGQAILEALGGKVLNVETNQSLVYNKENLLNPHFIAKTSSFLREEQNKKA
jgi:3'(2'), 5'-bisphosphate nucleotidase